MLSTLSKKTWSWHGEHWYSQRLDQIWASIHILFAVINFLKYFIILFCTLMFTILRTVQHSSLRFIQSRRRHYFPHFFWIFMEMTWKIFPLLSVVHLKLCIFIIAYWVWHRSATRLSTTFRLGHDKFLVLRFFLDDVNISMSSGTS